MGNGNVLDELLKDPSKLSPLVMLVLAVAALVKGWVVPAYVLTERDKQIAKLTEERDEFKAWARTATNVAEGTQRVRGGGFVGKKDHV